jgi:GDPmannose 4,6-dehydratase
MKLAFITGITGQDGSYLTELLLEKGYKVYGVVRRTSLLYSYKRLDHIRNKITLKYGDMTDCAGLFRYILSIVSENHNFEVLEIYNLASQSHVKVSFESPEYTSRVDGTAVGNLLEIIRSLPTEIRAKIKFYQAGSSEMYGRLQQIPQQETTPFNPVSPYAAAKLYAYNIAKCYREGYGLFVTNGILFNHESPRRGKNFVTMKIVNAVKDIVEGKRQYISLGNLNSKRDWGHAKDYVRGMWLMLQQDKPDDYVLATGKTYTIKEFVERSFKYKGIFIKWCGTDIDEVGIDKNGITRVVVDKKYFRPCEVDLLMGLPAKAEKELGWQREYDLNRLIIDMFEGH